MTARSLAAFPRGFGVVLALASALLLTSSRSRADYDWYNEGEGSHSRSTSDGDRDDDDGYVPPYENSGHATGEGFALGLRFAYALPLGESAKGSDLNDFTSGVLKGQLDLDYGLNRSFTVGLYLAVGGGFVPKTLKRNCDLGDASCKILALESGLAAMYHILPSGIVDPWVGANFGVEWLRNKVDSSVGGGSVGVLGPIFGCSVGADVQLGHFGFGPYFSPQFGRFMRAKSKLDFDLIGGEASGSSSGKIDNRTFHYWLNFGLRARYQF